MQGGQAVLPAIHTTELSRLRSCQLLAVGIVSRGREKHVPTSLADAKKPILNIMPTNTLAAI
jgi:hypothetical protein